MWKGDGKTEPMPKEGFSMGDTGWAPPVLLGILLWLQPPQPAPWWHTWTERLPLSKIWPKLLAKGL